MTRKMPMKIEKQQQHQEEGVGGEEGGAEEGELALRHIEEHQRLADFSLRIGISVKVMMSDHAVISRRR